MPTPESWYGEAERLRRTYLDPMRDAILHERHAPVSLCDWPDHYWNREPDSVIGRAVAFQRARQQR